MKAILVLILTVILLNSCAMMEKYKIDGEAIVRSDGKVGVQLKVVPRHRPIDVR